MSVDTKFYGTPREMIATPRPFICRALDYPGSVPCVGGIPVGLIRTIFGGLGCFSTCLISWGNDQCSKEPCKRVACLTAYCADEASRGTSELFCTVICHDKRHSKAESEGGKLINDEMASGSFMYRTGYRDNGQYEEGLLYSKVDHTGEKISLIEVKEDPEDEEVDCRFCEYGQIQKATPIILAPPPPPPVRTETQQ